MAETLLSPSNVLLFGRKVEDLKIVEPVTLPPGIRKKVDVASTANIPLGADVAGSIDGVAVKNGLRVLLKDQTSTAENGLYKVVRKRLVPLGNKKAPDGTLVLVSGGSAGGGKVFELGNPVSEVSLNSNPRHGPFAENRTGLTGELEQQLLAEQEPCFARIYGFSFEGIFYDLPRPVLFLVHGDGVPVSEVPQAGLAAFRPARAPGEPSLTGLAVADFQFSDDVLAWSYDKADYSIRMDVETGMFEDILLDAMLGGGSDGMDARGMNARGMNARGMNARGMNARGMNARGMNARGNSD